LFIHGFAALFWKTQIILKQAQEMYESEESIPAEGMDRAGEF